MLTLTTEPQQNILASSENMRGIDFAPFTHRSLKHLLNFGEQAARYQESCHTPEAKKAFRDWVAQQYGHKFVEKAISLWHWWSELTAEVQQQLQQIELPYWPISTALSLTKIGEHLEQCLAEIAELTTVTVRRIEQIVRRFAPKRPAPLRLGQVATDTHWEYIRKKLGLDEDELSEIQGQASDLALMGENTGEKLILTDDIVDALQFYGYKTELILYKQHHLERKLTAIEEKLENKEQSYLDLQAQANKNYAQFQEEVKEQQAEIARLREQLAKSQQQKSSAQDISGIAEESDDEIKTQPLNLTVSETNSEIKSRDESPVATVPDTVINEEDESPNLEQTDPILLYKKTTVTPDKPINNLLQHPQIEESAQKIITSKKSKSSQPKRKRKKVTFLKQISRLTKSG